MLIVVIFYPSSCKELSQFAQRIYAIASAEDLESGAAPATKSDVSITGNGSLIMFRYNFVDLQQMKNVFISDSVMMLNCFDVEYEDGMDFRIDYGLLKRKYGNNDKGENKCNNLNNIGNKNLKNATVFGHQYIYISNIRELCATKSTIRLPMLEILRTFLNCNFSSFELLLWLGKVNTDHRNISITLSGKDFTPRLNVNITGKFHLFVI